MSNILDVDMSKFILIESPLFNNCIAKASGKASGQPAAREVLVGVSLLSRFLID